MNVDWNALTQFSLFFSVKYTAIDKCGVECAALDRVHE